jgi:hypothetical protein
MHKAFADEFSKIAAYKTAFNVGDVAKRVKSIAAQEGAVDPDMADILDPSVDPVRYIPPKRTKILAGSPEARKEKLKYYAAHTIPFVLGGAIAAGFSPITKKVTQKLIQKVPALVKHEKMTDMAIKAIPMAAATGAALKYLKYRRKKRLDNALREIDERHASGAANQDMGGTATFDGSTNRFSFPPRSV